MLLSRRPILVGLAASLAGVALPRRASGSDTEPLSNPLVLQRADPHASFHGDQFYFTASVPEYDRIVLRRASTLAGLGGASETVLWRRPASGRMAGHIWAPEFHRRDGRWLIYFAAGDSDDVFRIRSYVLACDDADPIGGRWTLLGRLETPWDSFTLDATTFEHRGVTYCCWAQSEPGIATNSNLYLAPLATPTTFAAAPVRLTVPTLPWEVQGFKVAEGPAILMRNGRLFLTYSASATDARYCMGMLTAKDDADIMDPAAWAKSPTPVFQTSRANRIFGPGHNSFVIDRSGTDMLVYHARDYEAIEGDPLYDPNRHARVQPIHYDNSGAPVFGSPRSNGPVAD